jgi:hypothetical protein
MSRRPLRQFESDVRYQRDVVGPLMDLSDADRGDVLPPRAVVGWMRTGVVGGAPRYCLVCRPLSPSPRHVAVYADSLWAAKLCTDCGRRLDGHVA